ncbi:hypothetical protein [Streptomyces sp. 135]|uniref:hypothetical protein n=1 Tax=Streptomyces sp. 135 TaxID=2838850 RepID=UPI001CBE0626|nr:hypothetical protein [Streptomyces sp. 135]
MHAADAEDGGLGSLRSLELCAAGEHLVRGQAYGGLQEGRGRQILLLDDASRMRL